MSNLTVGALVHDFFLDYLGPQKGLRQSSIRSYRDTIRLFLPYAANDARHPISRLQLEDLNLELRARVPATHGLHWLNQVEMASGGAGGYHRSSIRRRNGAGNPLAQYDLETAAHVVRLALTHQPIRHGIQSLCKAQSLCPSRSRR
jgi:hypothetical protein